MLDSHAPYRNHHVPPQRPVASSSFSIFVVLNKSLQNSLSFFSVVAFPWLKPEALHEGCPTAVGFHNRPLGRGERGLYGKGVSHGFHVVLDVKRRVDIRSASVAGILAVDES